MARNEQIVRQHKLLQLLERTRFGRTLGEMRDDLVEELGLISLHPRSVRRDLDALQAAGFDIETHETQRGRVWKLGPRFRSAQRITASVTELLALSLSRQLLLPLAGTPFWSGIETFWSKIRESMPPAIWQHYTKVRQILYVRGFPVKSYQKQEGIIKTINRAIQQHRVLRVEYQGLGEQQHRVREIEPYGVVVFHSSLYIVAAARDAPPGKDPFRHFKLDRFRRAQALDTYFKPRPDFDLQRHLGQGIGIFAGGKPQKFKIWVSAYAASWVLEDPWHENQSVERHRDGSVTLTIPAAHQREILPRVLALGTEAEVVAPRSCRRAAAVTVRHLMRTYQKD